MFLGKYTSTLNTENHLSIPSPLKEQILDGGYITQGFDRNLLVLTAEAFDEIYRRVKSLNIADPLARLLQRMILGTASQLSTSKDGYLTISGELKEFASLGHEVLLIGQGDYFEIWATDLWEKQEAELQNADANAIRFSALTISTRS